jgi:transposase
MKYVGVDLHKQTISVCVVVLVGRQRKVELRRQFRCSEIADIRAFFQELEKFQVVVEATSSYEWFLLLVEDLADRCLLAHPRKMRVIAESKNKSDKIDAQVLAEFLALDIVPEAWRPTPRVREHRVLVRHRRWLSARITSLKCKLRHKLAHYNADIAHLFTQLGEQHLSRLAMSHADGYEVKDLREQLELLEQQLARAEAELKTFAKTAPLAEREARAVLATIPQVGEVTIDVVLSELGDARRFRNAKQVVAYAGLDPGFRESDGKKKQLHICKEGSRILRWALIQAAWRMVVHTRRWQRVFEQLLKNTGSKKKAIVAVARRLLGVMVALLRDGRGYQLAAEN